MPTQRWHLTAPHSHWTVQPEITNIYHYLWSNFNTLRRNLHCYLQFAAIIRTLQYGVVYQFIIDKEANSQIISDCNERQHNKQKTDMQHSHARTHEHTLGFSLSSQFYHSYSRSGLEFILELQCFVILLKLKKTFTALNGGNRRARAYVCNKWAL